MAETVQNKIIVLSQEEAEMTADQLLNAQKTDGGAVTIYSGEHADHGNIYVVIPAFGASYLLLPFETLDL